MIIGIDIELSTHPALSLLFGVLLDPCSDLIRYRTEIFVSNRFQLLVVFLSEDDAISFAFAHVLSPFNTYDYILSIYLLQEVFLLMFHKI